MAAPQEQIFVCLYKEKSKMETAEAITSKVHPTSFYYDCFFFWLINTIFECFSFKEPLNHYCATSFLFDPVDFIDVFESTTVPLQVNGKFVHLKMVTMPTESSDTSTEDYKMACNAIFVEKAVLNGLCRSSHEGLIQYLGYVEVDVEAKRNIFFLSEFIAGITFKQWNKMERSITYIVRLELTRQISEALMHVHKCGYAHNDISSNNIMICEEKATIIDFGNARAPGISM